MPEVLLGLGGNLGDPVATLEDALRRLEAGGLRLLRRSRWYRTAPWGDLDQPEFVNLCVAAETALSPRALLGLIHATENALGRVRGRRWGPRTLDIDILLYGDESIDEPDLTIPHPRLTERAFVLVPLLDIAPDRLVAGRTVRAFAEEVGREGVTPFEPGGAAGRAGAEEAMAPAAEPSLASEFPPASLAQWQARVAEVLKGASAETLAAPTHEGLRIAPLHPKAERPPAQPTRPASGPWGIVQRVDHPDAAAAHDLALADLEGGADGLALVFPRGIGARGFGLRAAGVEELDRALRDVRLDLVHLRLDAGPEGVAKARLLADLAARRGHSLADLDLDLGLDPIGALAVSGAGDAPPAAWEPAAADCARALADLAGRGFRGRGLLADGRPYHEAGAGEAQELAAVLATALAYLRLLEHHGQSLAAARDALSFLLVADADVFLTLAKLRALRRLWARVESASGLPPAPMRLHAETAWRATTRRDPWVNMLRATAAVFAAGLGGADTIAVLPFTAALGLPDGFARRIARNTQLVLLEEAHLGRVADPAAGAGALEALTAELCERAWRDFQAIEGEGGIVASLAARAHPGRIAAVRAARAAAVATRRDPITGTSEFPDLAETPVAVLLPAPTSADTGTAPLPSVRLAEPFERLRDLSDRRLAQGGARPRVFLATLGPPDASAARAGFARNLFEAGGFEVLPGDAIPSPDAAAAAFAASGARVACLCASDEAYAAQGAATARALRAAGARRLYLVGRPQALAEAPVDGYLFAGCDAFALLAQAAEAAAP